MTDDHPPLDELAELDEGLLPAERGDAIRAHLAGCDACRGSADALISTRSMLAGLPHVSMPTAVRARLDAAIAAESPRAPSPASDQPAADPSTTVGSFETTDVVDTAGHDGAADESGETPPTALSSTVVPTLTGRVSRRRLGHPTLAASAAAAAVVLALGAIVVGHARHNNHEHGSASTAAQAATSSSAETDSGLISGSQPGTFHEASSSEYYNADNLAALAPGLLGSPTTTAGSLATPSASTGVSSAGSTGSASGSATTSGTTSTGTSGSAGSSTSSSKTAAAPSAGSTGTRGSGTTSSKLSHRAVTSPLAAAAPPAANGPAVGLRPASRPIPTSLVALSHSPGKLLACARTITGVANVVPLAVGFGRWTGGADHNAASIIFLFKGFKPDTGQVFVVAPACDSGSIRTVQEIGLND